jgi:hypothetical protein
MPAVKSADSLPVAKPGALSGIVTGLTRGDFYGLIAAPHDGTLRHWFESGKRFLGQ